MTKPARNDPQDQRFGAEASEDQGLVDRLVDPGLDEEQLPHGRPDGRGRPARPRSGSRRVAPDEASPRKAGLVRDATPPIRAPSGGYSKASTRVKASAASEMTEE